MKNKRRTICVVTTSRAEYGVLRWTMAAIQKHPRLKLQVLATGAHLAPAFGSTYRMIERDGLRIDAKIPMGLSAQTPLSICRAMARCLEGTAKALQQLKPDVVFVAGDRYELLPICSAALVLGIPVAHMSGGDVTEGALDNQVRHAVSKIARLHFPGTAPSARRLIRMGEEPAQVFLVGEPGPENFRRTALASRASMARLLGLDSSARWILFTYHPETLLNLESNLDRVKACLKLLREEKGLQTILLDPNADFASSQIADELRRQANADPVRFRLLRNLQPSDYTNLMRHCYAMLGNSSAGLLEAPSARLAVIDVGDRQKGRLRTGNIVHASGTLTSLRQAWRRISAPAFRRRLSRLKNPFGDGHTGARIARILARIDPARLPRKGFYSGGPQ